MPEKDFDLSGLTQEFEKLLVDIPISKEGDESTITLEEGERRDVVILFLDIVGFTKLAEKLDPEHLKAVVSSSLKVITNQIKKFGGVVEKYIGDAVCAVFGRHESHEDDPARAVSSGLSILEKLEDINAILSPKGITLHVRIGINTGTVVTGQLESFETITGEAINIAQRLEANAPEDKILISEPVWEQCKQDFEFEKVPPLTVKNVALPIQAYKVLKKLPEEYQKKFKGAFVNREQELKLINEAWNNAKAGNLSFIAVSGEAGIGKTRLIEEAIALNSKSAPMLVFRGHAQSFGADPYHIFADIINDYLKIAPLEKLASIEEVKDYIIYIKDVAGSMLQRNEKDILYTMDPRSRAVETELALKKLLSYAGKNGACIVIDNLQWISTASSEMLDWLAKNLGTELPILFILSFREEASLKLSFNKKITLDSLDDSTLNKMLEGSNLTPLAKKKIVKLSSGNPYFLIEMIKAIEHNPLLSDTVLPQSVRALVMAQFDRLPKEDKFILQLISSAGGRFPLQLASDVIGRFGLAYDISKIIDGLSQSGIIAERNGSFEFMQAVTESTVYNTILNVNKTKIHRVIAEWHEASGAKPPHAYLAEQWLRANDQMKAADYYMRAGIAAKKGYANMDAILYYEKACALFKASPSDERLHRIYCDLASLYDFVGDLEKYRYSVEAGISAAKQGAYYYYLLLHRINLLKNKGEIKTAKEEFDKFLSDKDISNFPDIMLKAYLTRWQMSQVFSEDGTPFMEKTMELARSAEEPYTKLQVDQTLFNHYKNANNLKEAEKYLKRVDEVQSEMDPFNKELAGLFFASFYWDKQDRFDEIKKRSMTAIKYFSECGWQRGLGMAVFYTALAYWRLESFKEGEELLSLYMEKIADADTTMRLKLVLAAILLAQGKRKQYLTLKARLYNEVDAQILPEVKRQLNVFEAQYTTDAKQLEELLELLKNTEDMATVEVDKDEHQLSIALILARLGRKEEALHQCEKVYGRIEANEKRWFLDMHQKIINLTKAS